MDADVIDCCLLVIDDGRGTLERSLLSAALRLPQMRTAVVVDDSTHELGFAGAIAKGWDEIAHMPKRPKFVFHLESDFMFQQPVDIRHMAMLLEMCPYLRQVSLLRQPVNDREKAAGGIIHADPNDFIERSVGKLTWVEQRRYFTTNPSLYRSDLCELGWPQVEHSEGVFTHQLLEDKRARFAIWGSKWQLPKVWHIGDQRTGWGY